MAPQRQLAFDIQISFSNHYLVISLSTCILALENSVKECNCTLWSLSCCTPNTRSFVDGLDSGFVTDASSSEVSSSEPVSAFCQESVIEVREETISTIPSFA